jgi:hypothetical protein
MSLTLIPKGIKHGGQVITNLRLLKVNHNADYAQSALCQDVISGEFLTITFAKIFMCAGAVQTPLLLRKSELISGVQRIGFHINTKVVAKFPNIINAENGTIFTEQVQEFMDKGILMMATNLRPEYLGIAYGNRSPEEFLSALDQIRYLGLYTVQIKPINYGRLLTNGKRTLLSYSLCQNSRDLLREGLLLLSELLFFAGAEWIELPTIGGRVSNMPQAKVLLSKKHLKFSISSVHAMSSLPMGTSNKNLVNTSGQLGNFKNLYVADASILPTTIGESPQGTIMAIARNMCLKVS